MVNSLHYTFYKIFESQIIINKENNYVYPIISFIHKQNIMYIYDFDITSGNKLWRQMNQEDFVLLLKIIQQNLICELSKWKNINKGKFDESDRISELFNKAIIKLMNLSFTPDHTFSKIRNFLYNHIKTELQQSTEIV